MMAETGNAALQTPLAGGVGTTVPDPMLMGAVAFATSAVVCYLIVRSVSWHLPYTADLPGALPQKVHTGPVPRIGGAGVLIGMLAAGLVMYGSPAELRHYWLLILSLLPAFLGGFCEDLTRRVGPGARLLLTVVSATFAFSLAGVHFERSHMAWLDRALAFLPFGYLALIVGVAGVAHAMNIVDGYNGLAAGVATIALVALGYVAHGSGDGLVAAFALGAAAATLGFLLFNYPSGRLFLGDSGAYLLGCAIAFAAALLVLRNREVSPWFPFALVVYPVWETLFSAVRRLQVYRRVSEPDARHLHSLVYRRLSRRWVRGRRAEDRLWRNSLTTLPFWLANLVVAACAVAWAEHTRAQQLVAVLFIALYLLAYWTITRPVRPRWRRSGAVVDVPRPG